MTTPRPWRDTVTGLSPAGLLPLQAARTITVEFQDESTYFQLIARTLCPGARLGHWLRHAINKLPDKLVGLAAPRRKGLRSKFHSLLHRCRTRTR